MWHYHPLTELAVLQMSLFGWLSCPLKFLFYKHPLSLVVLKKIRYLSLLNCVVEPPSLCCKKYPPFCIPIYPWGPQGQRSVSFFFQEMCPSLPMLGTLYILSKCLLLDIIISNSISHLFMELEGCCHVGMFYCSTFLTIFFPLSFIFACFHWVLLCSITTVIEVSFMINWLGKHGCWNGYICRSPSVSFQLLFSVIWCKDLGEANPIGGSTSWI